MAPTPMMQQYEAARRACPGALLLFRMGDFYEMFFDDAKRAAEVLNLTLTSREKNSDNPVPMAGFPHHQLETYLARIVAAGMRAAICEQVEDPKQARGLVKREVTRIVTPGTLTDDTLLDPRESNFLAAVAPGATAGLAWVELSTGRFHAAVVNRGQLVDELARIGAAECLLAEDAEPLPAHLADDVLTTRRPGWAFAERTARESLAAHFGTATLEGFGFDADDAPAVRAAGAIIDYLNETQRCNLDHIDRLSPFRASTVLEIDQATRRSLEITRTLRDGRREGSLLAVIDQTVTAMGSRLLADWVSNPLTHIGAINGRLGAVEELHDDDALTEALRGALKKMHDVQRLVARVTTERASPRDLGFLAATLGRLPTVKAKLAARRAPLLVRLEERLDLCAEVRAQLDAALADACPLSSRDGGLIREGYDEELDALRELATGGKQWIAAYQAQESERSSIPHLKVGFNKVFGYYLEVTNPHLDKVPEHYIRKQTVKNAERYVTPQLKEYEEKVLTAVDESKELEYRLFVELRARVAAEARRLRETAGVLAELDVLCGLAELARRRGYTRPELSEDAVLDIREGRHPVLDVTEPAGTFVPNDVQAGGESRSMLVITGPNMAGKSTYIRQVALITLLAQIGSFVPARSATIGVADRIFARVGASDELSRGQSTFMVEMTETARILNTATSRSLVILDEIGRGTSTYDGVSLAWAVVEYLHDQIGCRTLFATHYHELTDLEQSLASVENLNVAVREWGDELHFLHKIVPGAADKSYGIHVARLAGVPREVVERAKELLAILEAEHVDAGGRPRMAHRDAGGGNLQLRLFGPEEHPLLDVIRAVDVEQLTPIEALQRIVAWQEQLGPAMHGKPR